MRFWVTLFASAVVLIGSGCAGLKVVPVPDATAESTARGYRYYPLAPYLFVRSDGKGGLTSEIVYLPDSTQKMSIEPYAYLASINATLTFNNGSLNEASVVGDETIIPNAIVSALGKAASAAIAAADIPAPSTATAPIPYLFKIIVHGPTITLAGGPAVDMHGNPAVLNVSITAGTGK